MIHNFNCCVKFCIQLFSIFYRICRIYCLAEKKNILQNCKGIFLYFQMEPRCLALMLNFICLSLLFAFPTIIFSIKVFFKVLFLYPENKTTRFKYDLVNFINVYQEFNYCYRYYWNSYYSLLLFKICIVYPLVFKKNAL